MVGMRLARKVLLLLPFRPTLDPRIHPNSRVKEGSLAFLSSRRVSRDLPTFRSRDKCRVSIPRSRRNPRSSKEVLPTLANNRKESRVNKLRYSPRNSKEVSPTFTSNRKDSRVRCSPLSNKEVSPTSTSNRKDSWVNQHSKQPFQASTSSSSSKPALRTLTSSSSLHRSRVS